jgi:hypothetical protein
MERSGLNTLECHSMHRDQNLFEAVGLARHSFGGEPMLTNGAEGIYVRFLVTAPKWDALVPPLEGLEPPANGWLKRVQAGLYISR